MRKKNKIRTRKNKQETKQTRNNEKENKTLGTRRKQTKKGGKDQCCIRKRQSKTTKNAEAKETKPKAPSEKAPSLLIRLIRLCATLINPHTPKTAPEKTVARDPE